MAVYLRLDRRRCRHHHRSLHFVALTLQASKNESESWNNNDGGATQTHTHTHWSSDSTWRHWRLHQPRTGDFQLECLPASLTHCPKLWWTRTVWLKNGRHASVIWLLGEWWWWWWCYGAEEIKYKKKKIESRRERRGDLREDGRGDKSKTWQQQQQQQQQQLAPSDWAANQIRCLDIGHTGQTLVTVSSCDVLHLPANQPAKM